MQKIRKYQWKRLLKMEKNVKIFIMPTSKKNTGETLWGIRDYGLLVIKKCKWHCKKKLEKLASTIKLIINLFLAQVKKN